MFKIFRIDLAKNQKLYGFLNQNDIRNNSLLTLFYTICNNFNVAVFSAWNFTNHSVF